MQTRARIGFAALALAVAGGLWLGFHPPAVPVDIATVTRAPLAVAVEEEGKTRVRDRYVVSAPIAGYVRRVELRAGEAVRAGQALAVIEPSRSATLDPRAQAQAEAQVKAAEAAAAAAQENARAAAAQSDLARQELTRTDSLRQQNFISQQAQDRARSELQRSQAAKLAADHAATVARYELDVARAALARTAGLKGGRAGETVTVRSPVDARILRLVRESEGAVQAGQPLIEIGNSDALEVEVEVLSTQAVKIAPGTRVRFDRWGGEAALAGVVRVVEPSAFTKVSALGVEEQRVRVIVDFASPREQWARLGDGYRVEARFVVWEGADVLQVPGGALFRHRSGWAVFRVVDGRAQLVPVEIGQHAGAAVEIKSGVAAGDQVVAHPDDRVSDGARVKARPG
jgi:HlyD family secretion protein